MCTFSSDIFGIFDVYISQNKNICVISSLKCKFKTRDSFLFARQKTGPLSSLKCVHFFLKRFLQLSTDIIAFINIQNR